MYQNSNQIKPQPTLKHYTDEEIINTLRKFVIKKDMLSMSSIVTFLDGMAGDLSASVLEYEINGSSIFNYIISQKCDLITAIISKTSQEVRSQAFAHCNTSGFTSIDIILLITYYKEHLNTLLLNAIDNEALNMAILRSNIFALARWRLPQLLLRLNDITLCNIINKLEANTVELLSQSGSTEIRFDYRILHMAIGEGKSKTVVDALVKNLKDYDLCRILLILTITNDPAYEGYDVEKTCMYILKHLSFDTLTKLSLQILTQPRQPFTDDKQSILEFLAKDYPRIYNYILYRLRTEGTVADFNTAVVDLHRLDSGKCILMKMPRQANTSIFTSMQDNTIILSSITDKLYYVNPTHHSICELERNDANHSHYDNLKLQITKLTEPHKVVHDSKTLQLITLLTGVSPVGNAEYLYNNCYDFKADDLFYGFTLDANRNNRISKIGFFKYRPKESSIYEATCKIGEKERKQLKTAYECMREQQPSSASLPHDLAMLILHYIASLPVQIDRAVTEPLHTQQMTDLVTAYFLLAQAMKNFDRTTSKKEKLEIGTTVLSYLASNQGIEKIIKPVIEHRVAQNNKIPAKIKRKFLSWLEVARTPSATTNQTHNNSP